MLILASGIGGRMWTEKRHPGLTAERQNIEAIQNAKAWDKVIAPLMAVSVVFPMVIMAGLDHRFNWSPEFPLWLSIVGFIFIAFGYGFAAWALAENRFFSSVVRIQTDRGHLVCDTGPYRFVRHPGYAGSILPLLGILLALGSVWTLIPSAVALIIAVIKNRTGRPDSTGRVAGLLSRLRAACELSVDSVDILRDLVVGVPDQRLRSSRESYTPPKPLRRTAIAIGKGEHIIYGKLVI
jgi:protein-S-isoprenylcysteine O-methyltransferase Ste14